MAKRKSENGGVAVFTNGGENGVVGANGNGANGSANGGNVHDGGTHSSSYTPTPFAVAMSDSDLPSSTAGDDEGASAGPVKKKARLSEAELVEKIAAAARTILECIDDDADREGLLKTPVRYAKSLLNLTSGYRTIASDVVGDAQFSENHNEMVLVRGMDVFSHCEHHLLPFHGVCHVAYMPNGSVIGLSKIARIVDMYAHRLQVQERLSSQIADEVVRATGARGVMVMIRCTHMCMVMRGVRKTGAETITTVARGCYAESPSLRQEFLTNVRL